MATFDELSSELLSREIGNADSTQLFTTQRRQDAVIEGQREFARLTDCLIRQTSIACSNAVGEYDLLSTTFISDGDFVKIAAQEPEYRLVSSNSTASGSTDYVSGDDFQRTTIQRLNEEEPGWRDSTGSATPSHWYTRPDGPRRVFGMYPPPTIGSSETGTLTIPYVARPSTTFTSTGEPFTINSSVRTDLRDYHQALVHYAAAQMEKFRRDREMSNVQMQLFLGYVAAYLEAQRPLMGTTIRQGRPYFRRASRRGDRPIDPRRD